MALERAVIDWLGQRVGVYGFGKTGRACVEYFAPRLISPLVLVDETNSKNLDSLRGQVHGSYELIGGDDIPAAVDTLDTLILSPGVPLRHPNVQRAVDRGVLVISELELASRSCPGYILAITGTNGKSTTTMLLGHVLSALGPSHVLGNIGAPLLGSLDEIAPGDYVALEVSSFQLEAIDRFAPQVAIYTNLTPDHLDRHGTMEEYARVKRSMAGRMKRGSFVVTNALCPEFAPDRFDNSAPGFLEYRSTPGNRLLGAWVANERIVVDLGSEQCELPLECVKLPGIHNVENALAAVLAALLVGATPETIAERMSSFTGYAHRLECVRRLGGVAFYNDSKATNPEAAVTALKAMEPPLALILGGRDKMTDLSELASWVKRKAVAAVLLGEAAERISRALDAVDYNSIHRVTGLEEAVHVAFESVAASGGTVLLSPACASFDQYSGYEERGEHFKELVSRLQL
ncbi:UDP-N-acetylmuramoyl-L-alanine--D-glutamate ligase [bacterium]|nr:UDP-N-acetylmuramoyl-L-alanine--D-glutamate ligase [bacterium]